MRQVRQEAAAATATNNSNSWLMTMSTVVISQLSSPIADTTGQVRQGVRAGGCCCHCHQQQIVAGNVDNVNNYFDNGAGTSRSTGRRRRRRTGAASSWSASTPRPSTAARPRRCLYIYIYIYYNIILYIIFVECIDSTPLYGSEAPQVFIYIYIYIL